MSEIFLLLAGFFLPLFPMSMVFNEVFQRLGTPKQRIILLLVWPLMGVFMVITTGADIPGWIIFLALLTSILYGFRALALREMSLWISFMATSIWAILWLTMDNNIDLSQLVIFALGISAPLALLVLLSGELEKRFGAAYTGLYGGLAVTLPRFSGVLVFVVLAIVCTPLFPGFAAMLSTIVGVSATSFAAAFTAAGIWILWSWAGIRLLQGLIIGPDPEEAKPDLNVNSTWLYVAILVLLVISGIYSIG